MKKIGLLLILSVFLISIFTISTMGVDPDVWYGKTKTTAAGKTSATAGIITTIGDVIEMVQGILAKVFTAISTAPWVWLRVLFFVAIFAVMFQILQMKTVQIISDRKTAGILSFVIAFATVSIMPEAWLYLTISMYSGLVMVVALGIPLIIGLLMTSKAIKKKAKGVGMAVIAVGWILYIMMLSTAFSTLKAKGFTPSGPLEWFQSIAFTTAVIMIIICVWMAVSGKGKKSKAADIDLIGWFSDYFKDEKKTLDLGNAITEAENLDAQLVAANNFKASTDGISCKKALDEAETTLAKLSDDKRMGKVEKAVKKLKQLDADKATVRTAQSDLNEIRNFISQAQTAIAAFKRELAKTPITWNKIDIATLQGVSHGIPSTIDNIEDAYDTAKKAYDAKQNNP